MRVLYQHRTQARCAEGEHIGGVVSALRKLGHEVMLVEPPGVSCDSVAAESAGAKPHRSWIRKLAGFVAEHVPEIGFELCELAYNLWEFPRLLRRIRSFRPDLLYVRYSLFTIAPALAANTAGIPMVLEINDASFITRSRPLVMARIARWLEKAIFRRAALCVTISHNFADMAVRATGIGSDTCLVVPNAISPERFVTEVTPDPRRVTLGVVGAFVPWHGLDFMMEAVARLRVAHPNLHVLLVGDGPVRPALEAQVRQLGLQDIVEFTGFVPPARVPALLGRMDVCVIPDSNEHGSPMKLFEYMAMSKPVLAPRYPPIEEVVDHGKTGLLFAPRNLDDFCQQAEFVLGDAGLRYTLGVCGHAAVLREHTWEANVRRVLHSLAGTSATSAGA